MYVRGLHVHSPLPPLSRSDGGGVSYIYNPHIDGVVLSLRDKE